MDVPELDELEAAVMWCWAGDMPGSGLTSVDRSIVEKASSPTRLISDVIRSFSEVEVVSEAFDAPATAETLMPVVSSMVIARTVMFLRLNKAFSTGQV